MYKLMFFAPDGEYVTEGEFDNNADAVKRWNNIGSRWIFYPIGAIFKDGELNIFPEELLEVDIEHATIEGFSDALKRNQEYLKTVLA